ncbi:MAG: hypothetical protein GC202_05675 [Alphaproteobacteria bacterium]|nr:hypothetical protein [Alphaproteobacteria bacterium]
MPGLDPGTRRRFPVVVIRHLAFALLLAVPARAQTRDPDLPPVDPPGHWRQMTLDDATSDSKCVGKFDTPLCAVETVIACFTRNEWELCNAALRKPGHFKRPKSSRQPSFARTQYRIVRSEVLTQAGIDDIPRLADLERPGDLRIDVRKRDCYLEDERENCEYGVSAPNIFTLRRVDTGWLVVDWSIPDIRWPKRK